MTNKQQPGDRCQVVTAHGTWLNATIISTREGHGGALVRVDGWVTDVWAKPSEIRPAVRAVPEPDPHSTAYQGEVGDHQPRTTETVAKYGHVAKDDDLQYWRISQDENSGEVNVELTAQLPKLDLNATSGVVAACNLDPSAFMLPSVSSHLNDSMRPLGVSYDEQRRFIDAMAEFAKCGVTPEQLMEYVDAFARLIVTGATPEEVERFARQTLLNRASNRDESLHHITCEYRGAR